MSGDVPPDAPPGSACSSSACSSASSGASPPARPAWRVFFTVWLLGIGLYVGLALLPWQFSGQNTPVLGMATLDEVMHFLAFAMLAVALPYRFPSRLDLFLATLLLVLLGVATELAQLFIPARAFSLRDMGANVLGCLLGATPGVIRRMLR